jgi:small subunit ribosomal protein S3
LGYIRDWNSRWFARKKDFGRILVEDANIRKHIKKNLMQAAVSKIEIERASNRVRIIIHSGRPGVIIGRKGAEIDRLRDDLKEIVDKELQIDIKEVKEPAICAQLVAENIAFQMEKRIGFRRAMKKAVQQAMTAGGLDGAEIARSEKYMEGKVPLQTIKADIDYGFSEAHTVYGLIGVKVWICLGEILVKRGQGSRVKGESASATEEKK